MSIPQPPPEPLSLDERIRRTELRLIAREDSLRRRVDLISHRVSEAARPRRYVAPAIGILVASWALWMMLSRGGRARPVAHTGMAEHAAPPAAGSELPWVHLLALVWPLLPEGWRARISPATVATLVSLGLPLAERVFAPRAARR